jgi:type IV pilus assembly protein PilB
MLKKKNMRLGDLLVQVGKITEQQLLYALKVQKRIKKKIGEVLIELGYVTTKDIIEVLEFQLGIPHVDLEKYYIDPEIPHLISEEFARKNRLIPIKKNTKELIVAMSDPLDIITIEDLEIMTNMEIKPVIATEQDIEKAINQYYSQKTVEKAVEDFKKEFNLTKEEIDQELLREINNAPVVRLVNSIIMQASQNNASDIHIEPYEDILRIRFRIDGDLHEVMRPAKQTHGAIVTRIKIMGKMNIAERRLPQDGRVEMEMNGKELDLRISTIPTIYGEKVVIRILDRSNFVKKKNELGFTSHNLERFNQIVKSNNGIILVTGPTGSGKSATLYSILTELNDINKNIITIEDPVEYRMDGINQMQVNVKANLTFANGLRATLRQDPDIIMVGEIRDEETAEISIRAAITGHLVLSTLHTNSAPATISRLLDMGVEPYLVASSVVGVVAQRLVKKICPDCKTPYVPNDDEMNMLGISKEEAENIVIYKGKGCSYCNNTGYRGRTAIHEIMIIDKNIRKMIIDKAYNDEIKDYAVKTGMTTLQQNCRELILSGVTTLDEFLKAAYSIEG